MRWGVIIIVNDGTSSLWCPWGCIGGQDGLVVPTEITYMVMEDKYKYMVSKIHKFKVHIFKLHILYLKITKIHIFKSIEVSDFFLGFA